MIDNDGWTRHTVKDKLKRIVSQNKVWEYPRDLWDCFQGEDNAWNGLEISASIQSFGIDLVELKKEGWKMEENVSIII